MNVKDHKVDWLALVIMARECRKRGADYLLYRVCSMQDKSGQVQELKRMVNLPMEKKR